MFLEFTLALSLWRQFSSTDYAVVRFCRFRCDHSSKWAIVTLISSAWLKQFCSFIFDLYCPLLLGRLQAQQLKVSKGLIYSKNWQRFDGILRRYQPRSEPTRRSWVLLWVLDHGLFILFSVYIKRSGGRTLSRNRNGFLSGTDLFYNPIPMHPLYRLREIYSSVFDWSMAFITSCVVT